MAEMRNITELDLELAGLFYPILIECGSAPKRDPSASWGKFLK